MPCGCFGKKKKKEEEKEDGRKEAPGAKLGQEPPAKAEKKKDVIASDGGDRECSLLGVVTTGSCVDAPHSNSTPSTAPAASPASSVASSGRESESYRAQLVRKRREFFSDLYPAGERREGGPQSLPSTLPTAARARQFGRVRNMRPASQPPSPDGPAPDLPPGPHLLRHAPVEHARGHPAPDSGFASPDFLVELRSASDEVSRRWAMSDEERQATPSALKEKARTQKVLSGPRDSPTPTDSASSPSRSVDVVVIPPSPPSAEELLHSAERHPSGEDDVILFNTSPSAPPEYSEDDDDDDEITMKKLSSALEHDEDSFDLSDRPGELAEGGVFLPGSGDQPAFEIHPPGKEPLLIGTSIKLNHEGGVSTTPATTDSELTTNMDTRSPVD